MSLYESIVAEFPELADTEVFYNSGIKLRDDADGTDVYIYAWDYSKPIPESLKDYLRN
jgi:hypothetical protein